MNGPRQLRHGPLARRIASYELRDVSGFDAKRRELTMSRRSGDHSAASTSTGFADGRRHEWHDDIEHREEQRLCPEEPFRLRPVHAEGNELIQPRHDHPGPILADPDNLRGCRVMGIEEVAGVVTVAELRSELPEDLIDHIVTVEVDRGRHNAAFRFCTAECVGSEENDIADLHMPRAELTEQQGAATANDDHFHAVKRDRVNRTVVRPSLGDQWREQRRGAALGCRDGIGQGLSEVRATRATRRRKLTSVLMHDGRSAAGAQFPRCQRPVSLIRRFGKDEEAMSADKRERDGHFVARGER